MDVCVGPMILVEAGCFFEHIFALTKNECMPLGIQLERSIMNCEELTSHSEESTVFEYYILNGTIADIQHDFLYLTKVFIEMIINLISDNRGCCKKLCRFVWILAGVIFARHVIPLQICLSLYIHNTFL